MNFLILIFIFNLQNLSYATNKATERVNITLQKFNKIVTMLLEIVHISPS